jgi:hypothetical protein
MPMMRLQLGDGGDLDRRRRLFAALAPVQGQTAQGHCDVQYAKFDIVLMNSPVQPETMKSSSQKLREKKGSQWRVRS